MTPHVAKTPQAEADLLDHFTFIGADRPAAAFRFIEAANKAFQSLARMPGMGGKWQGGRRQTRGLRVWPIPRFRKYLIFYRELENGIEVVRVLYGSRNLDRLLIWETQ
jgi:toxin ParE1/3/4